MVLIEEKNVEPNRMLNRDQQIMLTMVRILGSMLSLPQLQCSHLNKHCHFQPNLTGN